MHVSRLQLNALPTFAAMFMDAVVPAPAMTLRVVRAPVAGCSAAQGIVAAVPVTSLADTC
jgi:hypothetical protein